MSRGWLFQVVGAAENYISPYVFSLDAGMVMDADQMIEADQMEHKGLTVQIDIELPCHADTRMSKGAYILTGFSFLLV